MASAAFLNYGFKPGWEPVEGVPGPQLPVSCGRFPGSPGAPLWLLSP